MSAAETKRAPRRGFGAGHGPGAMMAGEKPKDLKGTLLKMLKFMGNFKVAIAIVFVFAIGSTIFNIIGPKVLSTATTELFNGIGAKIAGTGGIDFDAIARILLFTLGLYLLSAICSFIQGWMMSSVSQRTSYLMRKRISEKIDRMPMGYFERNSVGDTLSRITNDVDTLGQSLNQGVTQLITSITTIVGVFVMMLSINPLMTLITVVMVPISIVLIAVVVKRSQGYFKAQQKTLGAINGQVEETFSGHAIVKAFGQEDATAAQFDQTNAKLYESAWKSQFISGLMMPIMTFVGNLGYVAVAIAGSFLAVQGVITVGDIQAFIQYVKNFTQPIT
ncbi:ABC transporter permease, partial [Raoultibacter timonensis]|uniref:ABC transporter permease n=1 Tax=Raoultibacter timonensis TaxID=1907662 RepID=UPI0026DD06E9